VGSAGSSHLGGLSPGLASPGLVRPGLNQICKHGVVSADSWDLHPENRETAGLKSAGSPNLGSPNLGSLVGKSSLGCPRNPGSLLLENQLYRNYNSMDHKLKGIKI
jgi:hypothetical protein